MMQLATFLGCQAAQPLSAAMIRISAGVRSVTARVVVNCLLVKHLPSSSADYTNSTIALRGRNDNSSFTDRHRNPTFVSPAGTPLLDVSAGGGPRPRKPKVWKTKTKKGTVAKAEKLIDVVNRLSNAKEEVYGALDAWIAWDLEFPLIAVKKALKTLKDAEDWRRIIQISKWMLDKGQGKTLATYGLLLQAFDQEGRIEEAEVLWDKVLRDNMECIPRGMFAQVIGMFDRYGKYKELLKVFADMDELQVKPDPSTVKKVARAYAHFGYEEYGQSLFEKYPPSNVEYRFIKGKRVRVRSRGDETDTVATQGPGSKMNNEPQERLRIETHNDVKERSTSETSNDLERSTSVTNSALEERTTLETSNGLEERLTLEASEGQGESPTLDTNNGLEKVTLESSEGQEESPALETSIGLEEKLILESSKGQEETPALETSIGLEQRPKLQINNELNERPKFETNGSKETLISDPNIEGKEKPGLETYTEQRLKERPRYKGSNIKEKVV